MSIANKNVYANGVLLKSVNEHKKRVACISKDALQINKQTDKQM